MGALSDYYKNKMLVHAFSGGEWTPPSSYYGALFSTAPNGAGGGTEVAGGSYAREAFTCTTVAALSSNAAEFEFPVATTDHGAIAGYGVYDAATGGNMVAYHVADDNPAKTYNTGETIRIPQGYLTIQLQDLA